jgi:transglutaminase-like putative cysteine protease
MQMHVGVEMVYRCEGATPMWLALQVHSSRAVDLERPDPLVTRPVVPVSAYRDPFGNRCSRLVAPAGPFVIRTEAHVHDDAPPETLDAREPQTPVSMLPESTLKFLLGSRYCAPDLLFGLAGQHFGALPATWARVLTMRRFVGQQLAMRALREAPVRMAHEVLHSGHGDPRDAAHVLITLCRALQVPARLGSGYRGSADSDPPRGRGDFDVWTEIWFGDRWQTLDALERPPPQGRVLVARGRDACDAAPVHTFAPCTLQSLRVWSAEATASVR